MQAVAAVIVESLALDAARVERVGVNLANALTPGYSREIVVGALRSAPTFAQFLDADAVTASDPSPSIARDLRPGTLKPTGQPWDLALTSSGYFEVTSPVGPLYTRRGDFTVDAEGRLVSQRGWPVAGAAGEIRPGLDRPSIDGEGVVRVGARSVGQIRVVRFQNPQSLRHVEGGYFTSESPPLADERPAVRQGFLENANVSHSHEMVELMRTMRHFEAMTRLLQGYDELIGHSIRKLGEA